MSGAFLWAMARLIRARRTTRHSYRGRRDIRFSVIGIVVDDMGRALDFYRLGLAIPDDAASEGHVEVLLPGDLKPAFDTVETIHSLQPVEPPRRPARDGGVRLRQPRRRRSHRRRPRGGRGVRPSRASTPSGACATRPSATRMAITSTCSPNLMGRRHRRRPCRPGPGGPTADLPVHARCVPAEGSAASRSDSFTTETAPVLRGGARLQLVEALVVADLAEQVGERLVPPEVLVNPPRTVSPPIRVLGHE